MAGGTPEHPALAASVVGLLFGQLRGGRCRVFDADLRVRVPATGLATYPDVTVVCGPREHDPEDVNSVVNPTLIVEVCSPSTEAYDRGEKFAHYSQLASLTEYVLVSHDTRSIEVRTRDGSGAFRSRTYGEGERAALQAVGAHLDVTELYESVTQPRE
jgi:Uma2 family endonuclease